MGAGIKIPIHEAIVFDLGSAGAERFLEQNPACVLFIGENLVNRFTVPFRPTSGRGDTLFLQAGSNFP